MGNPYNRADEDLLEVFQRDTPDFDLMNSVNEELHKIAAAPCRLYKLDASQSKRDEDDIYPEMIYRVYLPPVTVGMYYITPTWTEELNRLGINMPEEVVFSVNMQRLIETIRNAKSASSTSNAQLTLEFTPANTGEVPDKVYIFCDGERIYSHWQLEDGTIEPDAGFELNAMDAAGYIDLHHPAVNTVTKLVDFINNLGDYTASFTGDGEMLSIKTEAFAGAYSDYNDWELLRNVDPPVYTALQIMVDRTGGAYDNVADVAEVGDIIETFRRHKDTRDSVEEIRGLNGSPTHDPVTKSVVRGNLYEVRYAFVANETPSRHYINYNVTADKVPMDVLGTLLDKLPGDEPWTVGGDKWYA